MIANALALRHDTISECYADVRLLLYKIAHSFARRYNYPADELISEAHHSFVKCVDRYEPERFSRKSRFSSYVCFAVSNDLKTFLQKQRRHMGHLEVNEEVCGTEDPNQFLLRFLPHLEDDAKLVVSLVLEAPAELSAILGEKDVRTKCAAQRTLKHHLLNLGWTRDRVAIAFEEIGVLLTRY